MGTIDEVGATRIEVRDFLFKAFKKVVSVRYDHKSLVLEGYYTYRTISFAFATLTVPVRYRSAGL
jgi:hypothetical protein